MKLNKLKLWVIHEDLFQPIFGIWPAALLFATSLPAQQEARVHPIRPLLLLHGMLSEQIDAALWTIDSGLRCGRSSFGRQSRQGRSLIGQKSATVGCPGLQLGV